MNRKLMWSSWLLSALLAGAAAWGLNGRSEAEARAETLGAAVDSMKSLLVEAKVTSFQLERKREDSERMLKGLMEGREDLQRMYEKEKAASDEAIAAEAEALRQSLAAKTALQGEQVARAGEREQRLLVEAQKDSIDEQQRITARANLRLQASKVAQNSMALKGDPRLRGLMAVQALRAMDHAAGDVNKEEIVRALQGALDELERTSPVGIMSLSAGPRAIRAQGTELLVLGNDGLLCGVDPSSWRKRTVHDLSSYCGKSGGRAFLGDGVVMTVNVDRGIALCSVADGSLIAREDHTPHKEDIISMAAFGAGKGLVTGDRDGRLVVWSMDGDRLRVLKEHVVGGNIRAMVTEAKSGTIVALNGTERVFMLTADGTLSTLSLSDADRAHCLAAGAPGEVLIGSHQGSIWALRPGERELRRLHVGGGQRVESIAVEAGDGRHIAFSDVVKGFTVFDRRENTATPFRLALTGSPNVMAFGAGSVVYLGYEDKTIRRVFTESGAMGQRVCALAGRSWTQEEWARYIGEGRPEPTCASTP